MPQVLTSEKIESILNTRLANSNSGVFVDAPRVDRRGILTPLVG